MSYEELINSKYAEPAAVIAYAEGKVRILAINDRFIPELWMNVSEEEYREAFPEKIFDEDNQQAFFRAVRRCAETGEEQTVECWRAVFSNCCGFDKICLKSRLILIEQTPEETVIYEGIRNISNERRTRDTLEDIEYRYKKASEQINIYNWEYTIATKEMRPCYRCMRDLGLPALVTNYPEPAIDMGIFPPDYADMYRDMMRRIDEGAPELEADIPLTVGRIPFRVKYTTEFDENGVPVKAFGSATLISEKELGRIKLDDQIIGRLAEDYSCIYLMDFISDTVKIVKQEGIFDLQEGACCKDLSFVVATKLQEIPMAQRALLHNVAKLRTDVFADCDRREFVFRDSASEQWVRIDYHVIERGSNGVDRLLVTATVIDDSRARKMDADRLIARQKRELEDRQKMLLQAIDEANRANEAKTAFFSSMSHDIRTPMSAITGFSRLAMEEMDDREHLGDYLNKIVMAGEHLTGLINDILDMSQIESGKMELSTAPVVLKGLMQQIASMIQVRMDGQGLRFSVDVDEMGEDAVFCDKLRFNQVLLNLLSNACKYTPEGGQVFLTGRLKERGKTLRYEIRVRDTGIGMSPEFCEHIWDAYSREKTEAVHETQGTGLGMTIVRSIVNLMNGTIDLTSEQGKGSEFVLGLAFSPAEEAVAEADEDREAEAALAKDYTGVTVLVVDDTMLNLWLAERNLEKYGFSVKKAESGVEALEILEKAIPGEIDLILMDVRMPVMDGLETTRRIRAMEGSPYAKIPVIAMTANAFTPDVQKALEAGMNAHVAKPYTERELITTIYRFCRADKPGI